MVLFNVLLRSLIWGGAQGLAWMVPRSMKLSMRRAAIIGGQGCLVCQARRQQLRLGGI